MQLYALTLPYSENFEGGNFRKLVENTIFVEKMTNGTFPVIKWSKIYLSKTFVGACLWRQQMPRMPPMFGEKTFVNSYKTSKLAKVFSLESFPLYGMT